MRLKGTRPKR